jgi:P-type conjugative transfer protein TrbL
MRNYILPVVLAVLALCLALPEISLAADADAKILDTVVSQYHSAAKEWEPALKQAATRLFLILCAVSLVFNAGFGFIRGGMGLGDFFAEFLRFGITMGFFFWLLNNGPEMAKSLIDSMTLLGQTASSTYMVKLTPSDICTQGFGLIYDAVAEFGKSDYATGVLVIVIALMIALVFAVIAAQMVVLLCSSWILIYGGVFYLGFGGGSWTSEIAKNYFKTVLAQAMQVFTFCLLLGIGQKEILNLTVGLRTTKSVVVANYWWLFGVTGESATKVVQSETLTMTGMCVALVFAVILCILVGRVPGLVAGVVNGSSISAMSFGGVGGAVGSARGALGSAAGMATGAGMMVAGASGAKMALNSAYKAMQDHRANGEGSFAGGGATGGLRGMVNSASDMASSLLQGYAQSRTAGGMVAGNIDGKVQTRQAERKAAEAADGDAGSAVADGGDSSGGNGKDGGTVSANPFERSGVLSGANPGGGMAGGAVPDAGHGDDSGGAPGGGAAQGAFEPSPELDSDREIDEWHAAIANFNPDRIGLPDS